MIMHALAMAEVSSATREGCATWATMHTNSTTELIEEGLQLCVCKQCKGKKDPAEPKKRTGECLVKIRPRLAVHGIWAPTLKFWHTITMGAGGKVLRQGPPPGPLVHKLVQ